MSETTHVGIDIAKKLDGSETEMFAILVDSWGDKLVIELTCDENMGDGKRSKIETADFFMPCAHCGNAVLECNFEEGVDYCDRCNFGHKSGFTPYTKYIPEGIIQTMDDCASQPGRCTKCGIFDLCTLHKCTRLANPPEEVKIMSMEERIKVARQEAEDAFWAVIVKHFPEANDGSFLMSDMDDIMLSWVQHWVECNVPTPKLTPSNRPESNEVPEYWADELNLHYKDTWHNHQTGGGCMVVTSDNVCVAGEHRYLGVTSECVIIYTDTFKDDEWLQIEQQDEEGRVWSFGDNPCVLMNMLDEHFGGGILWDTNKLFDDIITIAKSQHV